MEKFLNYIKAQGASDEQMQAIQLLLFPVIKALIQNYYTEAFTPEELNSLELVSIQEDFDDAQQDLLMQTAFEEKTGKTIEAKINEYFENIVKEIEINNAKVKAIIEKNKNLDPQKFVEEFEEYMKILEEANLNKAKDIIGNSIKQ